MPTVLYTHVDDQCDKLLSGDRQPSPVYHTDRPAKLTAPETIDVTTHMIGAHQNLNGSGDLTTPLSGMVCHPWASTYYR